MLREKHAEERVCNVRNQTEYLHWKTSCIHTNTHTTPSTPSRDPLSKLVDDRTQSENQRLICTARPFESLSEFVFQLSKSYLLTTEVEVVRARDWLARRLQLW